MTVDEILDKLARDVESSIHAFYRGDVRQHTHRVKTDTLIRAARESLAPMLASTEGAPATASSANSNTMSMAADEVAAATRCVMAWLPMGPPTSASAESRCVSAAKEMAPTWGEREKARLALKRSAG